ncbi:hypothetical protein QUF50_04885 [Thiotrichales bacterium HSG1]|nr:hypothetical protein [Thiotrichales bacterium HSG1]
MKQIITLATLVALEALRTSFFVVIVMLLLVGFGLSIFIGQTAIVETVNYQSSLLAAFLRLSAIYVISLFVITSMVHEFHNNSIYLWLSLSLQRSSYFIGKFSGFALIALLTATLFGLALLNYVPYSQVGLWSLSLFCELLIVIAVSLLCVLTFHQVVQSFSMVLGFYILARSIGAIQLMALNSLSNSQSLTDQFINGFIKLLAMLLPNLENFTQSAWLVYHTGSFNSLIEILLQTAIYVILLISMSLFDIYRKNL